MTPTTVGLVLVEGDEADGATMERDAFTVRHGASSEQAAAAVLRTQAKAASRGHRLHSIGVTWSEDADIEASLLLKSLTDSGFDNVVPVRLPEATEALARGIAAVIGYGTTAVCVVEPECVIALVVNTDDGAVQTAVNHAIDSVDALVRWLSSVFTQADWQPEALIVVGSASDDDAIMVELEEVLSVPVFTPAEAELALARGAALASAQGREFVVDVAGDGRVDHAVGRRRRSLGQVGAMTALVAGVVTFVVSGSIAAGLQLTSEETSRPPESRSAEENAATPAQPRAAVSPPRSIPAAPPPVAPPPADLPAPEPEVALAPPPAALQPVIEAPAPVVPVAEPAAPVPQAPIAPPPVVPQQIAPAPVPPVPTERPGILGRIRDRIAEIDIGKPDNEQVPPAPVPPPAPVLPPPPPP